VGAQCIERVGQRFLYLAGVHQLAQQGVHQPGEGEPVGGAAKTIVIPPAVAITTVLIVRAQQVARPEEQGRCVLAPRRDDVVGGILQPGPQPAGQSGIEARAGRCVAAQQGEDLGPRASICHGVCPEQGTGCDENHRCSVSTGCDIP
jgi:hypothetical protein